MNSATLSEFPALFRIASSARLAHLDLVEEDFDIKGGVEVYHGVCGIEDHRLPEYPVDLAGAEGSYGPVGSARQPQLLVLTNALKHLHNKVSVCGKGSTRTGTPSYDGGIWDWCELGQTPTNESCALHTY